MSTDASSLGTCPSCESSIPSTRILIEYETDVGRGMYAECPGCRGVVCPS